MRKLIARLLGWGSAPRLQTFRYKYLRNPFDDKFQFFSVRAANQNDADKLAVKHFTEMFNSRLTVMDEFWPAA